MLTDINKMPSDARIWVYQCNRELTDSEVKSITDKTAAFANSWTSHNLHLHAACEIRYNRFLILMIDEKAATAGGCSIDSSVHFIQSLEKEYHVSFFDRMLFAFKNGNRVEALSKNEFEKAIAEGEITNETIVFNNLVQTKKDFDTTWELPLKNSWHKQVLAV